MSLFKSPIDAFLYWENKQPGTVFLKQPINGNLKEYTFKEAGQEIRKIAQSLIDLNLPKKAKVALLSKNCAHWIMADLAIMMADYVSVPIYPTLNANSIQYILEHSGAKAIIIGKLDDYESQKKGINNIKKLGISLYGISEELTWEDIVQKKAPLQSLAQLKDNDLITIIYTSGTTGLPKGVMHKVSSFAQVAQTGVEIMDFPETQ